MMNELQESSSCYQLMAEHKYTKVCCWILTEYLLTNQTWAAVHTVNTSQTHGNFEHHSHQLSLDFTVELTLYDQS